MANPPDIAREHLEHDRHSAIRFGSPTTIVLDVSEDGTADTVVVTAPTGRLINPVVDLGTDE